MQVARFRSQLFILVEQSSIRYRHALQALVHLEKEISYTVRVAGEAIRARKYCWPELRRGGAASIVLTKRGIESIEAHVSVLLRKAAVVGHRTQQRLVKPAVCKALSLGQAVHTRMYYWPEVRKGSWAILAVTSARIAKSVAYLAELSRRSSVHFRQSCHKVANTGREIANKPRKRREARKARENDLLSLMATSADAIVVMDDEHRFIAANENAMRLFGVSYTNIINFTLNSFIDHDHVSGFNRHGASKKGHCKIRRLDGNVRLAEYEFTADHIPFRHLCIFRNVRSMPALLAVPKNRPSPSL